METLQKMLDWAWDKLRTSDYLHRMMHTAWQAFLVAMSVTGWKFDKGAIGAALGAALSAAKGVVVTKMEQRKTAAAEEDLDAENEGMDELDEE